MNLLAHAPEFFLLLQESNLIHVRQIQPVQVAAGGANPGDQFNQDGRVSGPVSIGFHRGAIDEALLKIIQTLLQNKTQLRLLNQTSMFRRANNGASSARNGKRGTAFSKISQGGFPEETNRIFNP